MIRAVANIKKEAEASASGESATESQAKATLGANHVFQVFRQTGKPVTTLILSVVVMLVLFFVLPLCRKLNLRTVFLFFL